MMKRMRTRFVHTYMYVHTHNTPETLSSQLERSVYHRWRSGILRIRDRSQLLRMTPISTLVRTPVGMPVGKPFTRPPNAHPHARPHTRVHTVCASFHKHTVCASYHKILGLGLGSGIAVAFGVMMRTLKFSFHMGPPVWPPFEVDDHSGERHGLGRRRTQGDRPDDRGGGRVGLRGGCTGVADVFCGA